MNAQEFIYFIEISKYLFPVIIPLSVPFIAIYLTYKYYLSFNKGMEILSKDISEGQQAEIQKRITLVTHALIIFNSIVSFFASFFALTHIPHDIDAFLPIISFVTFYEILYTIIFFVSYLATHSNIKNIKDVDKHFFGTHIATSLIIVTFASSYLRNNIYNLNAHIGIFQPNFLIDNFNFQLTTFSTLVLSGTFLPVLTFLYQGLFSEKSILLHLKSIFGEDIQKNYKQHQKETQSKRTSKRKF